MTESQARQLLEHIRHHKNPGIKGFLDRIYRRGTSGFASLSVLVRLAGTTLAALELEAIFREGQSYVDFKLVDQGEDDTHRFGVYEGVIHEASGIGGLGGTKPSGKVMMTVKVPKACKGCPVHKGAPDSKCWRQLLPVTQRATLYWLKDKELNRFKKDAGIEEEFFKTE